MKTEKLLFVSIVIIIGLLTYIFVSNHYQDKKLDELQSTIDKSKGRVEVLQYQRDLLKDSLNVTSVRIDSMNRVIAQIPNIDSLYAHNRKNHEKNIIHIRNLNADSAISLFSNWTSKLSK